MVQGFPKTDLDEWAITFIAKDVSWKTLTINLITPWCKSRFWVNQVDFFDQITYRRVFNGILLKSIDAVFGLRFLPYYVFTKVFFFAGTISILFRFLVKATHSLLFAIVGSVFFAFVPAHYAHVLWVTDPATISIFFTTAAILAFVHITENLNAFGPQRNFLKWLSIFLILGWLGIRTKETALIVPMTVGLYTLLNFPKWKSQKLKLFLVLSCTAFIAFQIVPMEHLIGSSRLPTSYSLVRLSRILFQNYDVGYENEVKSAFFSLDAVWPVSIARTFGFYSLWAIVLFILIYTVQRWHFQAIKHFFDDSIVSVSFLWFCLELFLMGFFQPEPRFFSGTMIPITILLARLIYCVLSNSSPPWKYGLALISIFCVIWTTVLHNFDHVIWLRKQIGQRSNRFLLTASFIYKDHFSKEPSLSEIGHFYVHTYATKASIGNRMEDFVYHTELPYESWNKTKTGSVEEFKDYAKRGAVYYVTETKSKFDGYPNAELVYVVDGVNVNSLFERVAYSFVKKRPRPFFIFKHK